MTNAALKKKFGWRLKKAGARVGISLFAAIFLVASPILISIALVGSYFDDRRKRRVACQTPCRKCGRTLGIEALERAAEQQRLHPGIRYRLVRTVFAICTVCGAEYDFRNGVFMPVGGDTGNSLLVIRH